MTNKNQPYGFKPFGKIHTPHHYVTSGVVTAGDSLVLAAGTVSIGLAASGSLCGVAAESDATGGAEILVYDHPEQVFECLCANSLTTAVPGGIFDISGATGAQRLNDNAVGFRTMQVIQPFFTVDQPDQGANGVVLVKIAKHQMQGGGDIRHTSDPYASPAGDINIGVGNFTITALTGNFHSEGIGTIGPVAAPTITLPASGAIQIGVAAAEDLEIVPGTTFTLGVTAAPCVSTVLTPGATYGDTNIVGDLMLGPIAGPLMDLGIDGAIRCGLVGAPTFTVSTVGAVHAEGIITGGPVAAPSLTYAPATGTLTVGVAAAEGLVVTPGAGINIGLAGGLATQIDLAPGATYGDIVQVAGDFTNDLGDLNVTAGDVVVTAGNLEVTAGAINAGAAGAGLSIAATGIGTYGATACTVNGAGVPVLGLHPNGAGATVLTWIQVVTPAGAGLVAVMTP